VFYSPGEAPSSLKEEKFVREELGSIKYEVTTGQDTKCPRKLKVLLPLLDENN